MATFGATRSSPFSRWTRTLAACLLLVGFVSCSSEDPGIVDPEGPLVRLHLSPFDGTAVQVSLNVTARDAAGLEKQSMMNFTEAPLDLLGVTFPPGTRGATSYQVSLYSDASCLIAQGTAILNLDSDGVVETTVTMSPVTLCGNGATLTVSVANVNGGSGRITSMPAGIDCQSAGTGCSITMMKGASFTLNAVPSVGSFAGWTGAGCSGTGPCTFTLMQDTQVQGVFTTCRGWCREQLPFPVSANLNGVSGTGSSNILVVGDAGTALRWNGSTWQQLTPPSGNVALRAAAAKFGTTNIYVAGDGGTILRYDGTTWTTITNTVSSANLRAVAIGAGSLPDTYFVGDNTNLHILSTGATSVTAKNVTASVSLFGVSQNPNVTSEDVFMVGAQSGGAGFAKSWQGKNAFVTQMTLPGANIAGDIFAVLCGTAYHYAVGVGGAMVRRSSAANNQFNWMTVSSASTQSLRGLWAGSDTNVFSVGDAGTIVQYDGNTWSRVTPAPTPNNLRAIWGSSPTNIYAVGDGGVVLHYLP